MGSFDGTGNTEQVFMNSFLSALHISIFIMYSCVSHRVINSNYRNGPKFSDKQVWANSVDPDQTASDQGLHCLPFRLHGLDTLLYGRATLFELKRDYSKFFRCPNI